MKAIVKVNGRNQYAHLNYKTFNVKEVLSQSVCLDINGTSMDFSFKEVIIVDIEKELQAAHDNQNWNGSYEHVRKYKNLYTYCEYKGISVNIVSKTWA